MGKAASSSGLSTEGARGCGAGQSEDRLGQSDSRAAAGGAEGPGCVAGAGGGSVEQLCPLRSVAPRPRRARAALPPPRSPPSRFLLARGGDAASSHAE